MRISMVLWVMCWAVWALGCADAPTAPDDGAAGAGGGGAECAPGERRCMGETAQVCTGAGFWSLPQNCGGGTCMDGNCVQSCVEACTPGTARCAPEGLQRCETGPDGCGVWTAPSPCPDPQRCVEGQCAEEGCQADCSPGARRCVGPTAYTECAGEECPRWQPATDCGEGETCSGGQCVGEGGCEDQCGAGSVVCLDDTQFQRCRPQASGCLDFDPAEMCPPGRRCVLGDGCVDVCDEPACDLGEVRCFMGGQQTCVEDESGCVVWGAIINCPDGGQCRAGQCEAVCIPACSAGERRCTEGGVQYCERIDDCEAWGRVEGCPEGTECRGNGDCGECMDGEEESRACGQCGIQNRRCNGGSWGNWGLCGNEGVCEAGAVEACGDRCGTRTCTAQCEWSPCQNEGECVAGEESDPGTCGQCGWRVCNAQCQWSQECQRSGADWQRCNDCGWQFCCPDADWCPCAANPGDFGGVCEDQGQRCIAGSDGVCQ